MQTASTQRIFLLPKVSPFLQHFVHATWIYSVVCRDVVLELTTPVSKPNINSFIKTKLCFTHINGLNWTVSH